MSPPARGNLRGFLGGGGADGADEDGAEAEAGTETGGLCFIKKSRGAPRDREAMVGFGPRKRSSSL